MDLTAAAVTRPLRLSGTFGAWQVAWCREGWYINLQHAAGVITRYRHMQTRPLVHEGQTVAVGEPLGLVGSSGHSSGPHLHYETHLAGDRTPNGAVDPTQFMRDVG